MLIILVINLCYTAIIFDPGAHLPPMQQGWQDKITHCKVTRGEWCGLYIDQVCVLPMCKFHNLHALDLKPEATCTSDHTSVLTPSRRRYPLSRCQEVIKTAPRTAVVWATATMTLAPATAPPVTGERTAVLLARGLAGGWDRTTGI